jgi:hypothetical protein
MATRPRNAPVPSDVTVVPAAQAPSKGKASTSIRTVTPGAGAVESADPTTPTSAPHGTESEPWSDNVGAAMMGDAHAAVAAIVMMAATARMRMAAGATAGYFCCSA